MPRSSKKKRADSGLLEGISGRELEKKIREFAPDRNDRIDLRVTEEEKKIIKDLAGRMGMSMTELLVRLATIASEKIEQK